MWKVVKGGEGVWGEGKRVRCKGERGLGGSTEGFLRLVERERFEREDSGKGTGDELCRHSRIGSRKEGGRFK